MPKELYERRIEAMKEEGVTFTEARARPCDTGDESRTGQIDKGEVDRSSLVRLDLVRVGRDVDSRVGHVARLELALHSRDSVRVLEEDNVEALVDELKRRRSQRSATHKNEKRRDSTADVPCSLGRLARGRG